MKDYRFVFVSILYKKSLFISLQLYLLGLPNKLGPLGYISLHHVLDGADEPEDGDIVDVIIEPASVRKIEEMEKLGKLETVTVSSSAIPEQIVDEETIAPLFRRRRSLSGVAQRVNGVVQQAKLARGYFGIFLHEYEAKSEYDGTNYSLPGT